MARRILITVLIISICASITACGVSSNENLSDLATKFADGKVEENYHFKDSEALLDELIAKFSGSYYKPDGYIMSDDEYEQAKKNTQTDDNISKTEISNLKELKRFFYDAYVNNVAAVEFTTKKGYSVNLDHDLEYIYRELQRDDPINVSCVKSFSSWHSGNDYYVKINYSIGIEELKQIKKETLELVDDAINNINVDGKSDYEIVYAINEYLCDLIVYPPTKPYSEIAHTAYGALKNGSAVCEGYACAAKLLLNKLGIECDIETGECIQGGGHAWNLVRLNNQWYQLDVTWNDGSYSREDYFLITDAQMKKSRVWDETNFPKSAALPYGK